MEKLVIRGGVPLRGEVIVQGAKNVALKMFVASLLTDEEVVLHNVPRIRDVFVMLEVLSELGVSVQFQDHTVTLRHDKKGNTRVPLEVGARLRTSSLVMGPLLARFGSATVPNPGGCRLGARPIDRHIIGLRDMGAQIDYESTDGYFHATADHLEGATVTFPKNTHTGTEAIILAAVLAKGTTIIENAAKEVEIDDLIALLTQMGARISRTTPEEITIEGVSSLQGSEYTIMADRNEEVTWAVAAAVTKGEILVKKSERKYLSTFIDQFRLVGGVAEELDTNTTRYSAGAALHASDVTVLPHPGFMTDWQGPWAILMTQATGISTIHETVFESRFSYVKHLRKMGAHIDFFEPEVQNPEELYNFNWSDRIPNFYQAIRIHGPTPLHNAVAEMDDIRAGATLVLAALTATGESYLYSAENIDRGYEAIDERLRSLGASIIREKEDDV